MRAKLFSVLFLSIFLAVNVSADSNCGDKEEKAKVKETSLVATDNEIVIDRSKRTNPYPSRTFTERSSSNEASRYRTNQGWSRGRSNWWWGSNRSDIPTSGYTSPAAGR